MSFVKRWNIQKLTAEYQTLYYDGCEAPKYDGWSTDPEDALEFGTLARAQRRADRVGGDVFSHSRPATALEAAISQRTPFQFLQAAE